MYRHHPVCIFDINFAQHCSSPMLYSHFCYLVNLYVLKRAQLFTNPSFMLAPSPVVWLITPNLLMWIFWNSPGGRIPAPCPACTPPPSNCRQYQGAPLLRSCSFFVGFSWLPWVYPILKPNLIPFRMYWTNTLSGWSCNIACHACSCKGVVICLSWGLGGLGDGGAA